MADRQHLIAKIIKIIALVLAFVLLVKTFLCFLLSFAIIEEPPEDWPQNLKDDCYPKWYGWFSLIVNACGVVVYSYMYFGILNAQKHNLFIGLVGVTIYLTIAIFTHIVMWLQGLKTHTMLKLNWLGTAVSVVCLPLSYLHYKDMIIMEEMELRELRRSRFSFRKRSK